ncbi:hypothetical protein CL634_08880 [bacterium]|nr:hypothetical protein [bacterium]
MIKLIVFDLDGVLVEARHFHYEAMNRTLSAVDERYVISKEEHLAKYDGLSTRKKLDLLAKEKGLPKILHDAIWKEKQRCVHDIINEEVRPCHHEQIYYVLKKLKHEGYKIYCASNSIRSSVKLMLLKAGYLEYIDEYFSNQDVSFPKPHPEIYMKSMIHAGVRPKETLIVEDSHIGRRAAHEAGGHILGVRGLEDVTYYNISSAIATANAVNEAEPSEPKWQGKNMNVLIPMAGAGSRFAEAGYTFPKPLIEIDGKPMIQLVVENLNIQANYIFIVQKEHYDKYNLKHVLDLIVPGCKIVCVDSLTEGAACTTLLAKDFINNDNPLIIANSDQYANWNSNSFMYSMQADTIDGGILTFESIHPKWSFAKINNEGFVIEVAEKKPISNHATVGIYYWTKGSNYIKYAEQMIAKDRRVNNEFYVCPVFNEAVEDDKRIKIFEIDEMWGLGTPEDLMIFLDRAKASPKAVSSPPEGV